MDKFKSAGIVSMGGYLPAKDIPQKNRDQLLKFLALSPCS